MTLPFSQYFPDGLPTYFVEKIWRSLPDNLQANKSEYWVKHFYQFNHRWDSKVDNPPKPHTIRKDAKNRWREGMDIHFVINNRTKNRFQFAPVLKVKSAQKIEIKWSKNGGGRWDDPCIYIDGVSQSDKAISQLAKNDGFDSVDKFFNWFSEDFIGKIIHWTDLKY